MPISITRQLVIFGATTGVLTGGVLMYNVCSVICSFADYRMQSDRNLRLQNERRLLLEERRLKLEERRLYLEEHRRAT